MADNYQIVMDLIDNASPAIDTVTNKLKETAEASGKWGKGAAIGIGVIVTAAAAAYAALESMSKAASVAVNALADIGDKARSVGQSVEDYQIWVNTLGQLGVNADLANMALTNMTERIGESRQGNAEMLKVLERLNIPLKDANGHWRDSQVIINEIMTAIMNTTNASDRLRIAAQAGGDAMRGMLGNIADAPELWDRAYNNAKNNVVITTELANQMREARIELKNYEQETEALSLIADAALLPISQKWAEIKTSIALSTREMFYFLNPAKYAQTLPQKIAAVTYELKIAEQALADITGADGKSTEKFNGNWNSRTKSVRDLRMQLNYLHQEQADKTGGLYPEEAPEWMNNWPNELKKYNEKRDARKIEYAERKRREREEQVRQQHQMALLKDQDAVAQLELRTTKAAQDAKVAAIQDANKKIDAETALQISRIREDGKKQIDSLTMEEETKKNITMQMESQIASIQAQANQKKLENNKRSNTQIINEQKKLSATLLNIENQTAALKQSNEALITTGKETNSELEYVKELRAAYGQYADAKKYASERDAIKTALQLKRDASVALQQTRDDNTIKDQIRELVQQTNVINALTKEERELLEVRYAMEDLRKQSENPNEALLTQYREALINKNKAQETVEEAKKNAAEIESIYANAAQSIQGAFSDFFFDVMQGNMTNLADSFKKTIDRMVAELLAANLFKMVGGMGTGVAGESNLSGMFASFFGGLQGRAKGGPTRAGTPYWVGEQGPEIVIPSVSSTVIPADLSSSIANGNQAQQAPSLTTININAIDSRSFMETLEANDRDIVNMITETSQRYGMSN